eukprot:COSAG05_NODE_887_length_6737_cov_25.085719_2_plen_432_part_00
MAAPSVAAAANESAQQTRRMHSHYDASPTNQRASNMAMTRSLSLADVAMIAACRTEKEASCHSGGAASSENEMAAMMACGSDDDYKERQQDLKNNQAAATGCYNRSEDGDMSPPATPTWSPAGSSEDLHRSHSEIDEATLTSLKHVTQRHESAYPTLVFALYIIAVARQLGRANVVAGFTLARQGCQNRSATVAVDLDNVLNLLDMIKLLGTQMLTLLRDESIVEDEATHAGQDIMFVLKPVERQDGRKSTYLPALGLYPKASIVFLLEDPLGRTNSRSWCVCKHKRKSCATVQPPLASQIQQDLCGLLTTATLPVAWHCSLRKLEQHAHGTKRLRPRRLQRGIRKASHTFNSRTSSNSNLLALARQQAPGAKAMTATPHLEKKWVTPLCAACHVALEEGASLYFAYDQSFCSHSCRCAFVDQLLKSCKRP